MTQTPPELLVTTVHRPDCTFGPGFYRISLVDSGYRYCLNQEQVELAVSLLKREQIVRLERDGYCLDGDRSGDANTPDVVDGEQWLAMPKREAMEAVGLTDEADYARVYKQIEAAVYRRDNRAAQGGVRASIVIKRRGRPLIDVLADEAS